MTEHADYAPEIERRVRHLDIRGVRYAISEWGDPSSPCVFYLHGWGDNAATFQFVVDAFNRDWHVVAPDWRGFGGSTSEAWSYWFPDYLADLDRLLDHYSPAAAARLAGHSMGGNVAGLYAGAMPERVAAFANIEGFGLRGSAPEEAPARYRQWLEASREQPAYRHYADFDALALRIRKQSPGMSAAMADFVARAWAAELDGEIRIRADARHKLPNPVLYRREETEACWRRIEADVLLIAGERSPFLRSDGPLPGLPELAGRDWPLRTIPGAGHMLHFEKPAELAAVLEEFFVPHL